MAESTASSSSPEPDIVNPQRAELHFLDEGEFRVEALTLCGVMQKLRFNCVPIPYSSHNRLIARFPTLDLSAPEPVLIDPDGIIDGVRTTIIHQDGETSFGIVSNYLVARYDSRSIFSNPWADRAVALTEERRAQEVEIYAHFQERMQDAENARDLVSDLVDEFRQQVGSTASDPSELPAWLALREVFEDLDQDALQQGRWNMREDTTMSDYAYLSILGSPILHQFGFFSAEMLNELPRFTDWVERMLRQPYMWQVRSYFELHCPIEQWLVPNPQDFEIGYQSGPYQADTPSGDSGIDMGEGG